MQEYLQKRNEKRQQMILRLREFIPHSKAYNNAAEDIKAFDRKTVEDVALISHSAQPAQAKKSNFLKYLILAIGVICELFVILYLCDYLLSATVLPSFEDIRWHLFAFIFIPVVAGFAAVFAGDHYGI